MGRLTGRVALVTGASRGIGRSIAERFAAEGAKVALLARNAASLAPVAEACAAAGSPAAKAYAADVNDAAAVEGVIKSVAADLGGLDIVVSNAGVTRDNILMRLKEEDWDAVIDTNLKAAFTLTKAATRHLMKSSHGRLICVASVIGITGNAGQANYAASKGGLIAFTKSVAKELASRGVTANCIAPGFIETDMTAALDAAQKQAIMDKVALKRYGSGADIAAAAAFLASDDASYITGQVLVVDGGMVI